MNETNPIQTPNLPSPGHEISDVSARAVVWFVVGLVVGGGALFLLSHGLFVFLLAYETRANQSTFPLADEKRGESPSEPGLEGIKKMQARSEAGRPSPYVHPEDLEPSKQPALNEFAWVDKNKGIVRIPIDQAKRIVLEKSLLPARKK